MNQHLIFYVMSIVIIGPLFILIIRGVFKKSFMAKIGYTVVAVALLKTVLSYTVYTFNIPSQINIPIDLVVIISAILYLRRDILRLQRLNGNIDELVEFNLNTKVNPSDLKHKDEIGQITKSANEFILKLNRLIAEISKSSDNLYHAGNTVDSVSQQLSQGANEQAATTEEIASSMEEMATTIQANSEQSKRSGEIAKNASGEMNNSMTVLLEAVEAVTKISDKIMIVSEIADKTDLLSINAAIEAARAGEVGKGFAVVASEIRKLADRTKIASDEIESLSASGRKVSQSAGEKLKELFPEVEKSSKLINEIALASIEQKDGAETINTSVQQLTEITSENSSSAEQLASSAEQLASQAEQLKNVVSTFILNPDYLSGIEEKTAENSIKRDRQKSVIEMGDDPDDLENEFEQY